MKETTDCKMDFLDLTHCKNEDLIPVISVDGQDVGALSLDGHVTCWLQIDVGSGKEYVENQGVYVNTKLTNQLFFKMVIPSRNVRQHPDGKVRFGTKFLRTLAKAMKETAFWGDISIVVFTGFEDQTPDQRYRIASALTEWLENKGIPAVVYGTSDLSLHKEEPVFPTTAAVRVLSRPANPDKIKAVCRRKRAERNLKKAEKVLDAREARGYCLEDEDTRKALKVAKAIHKAGGDVHVFSPTFGFPINEMNDILNKQR